jgi:predicted MPP superfamily phosphohydrolase
VEADLMPRFIIFLLTFLAVYAAMHAVVFFGVWPLLAGHPQSALSLAWWMALMVVAPILAHLLHRWGLSGTAKTLALAGYLWMGFLFLAFSALLALFTWNLVLHLLAWPAPAAVAFAAGPRTTTAALLLVAAAGGFGILAAGRPRLEKVCIETDKLPADAPPLRVAQISDLHLGLLNGRGTVRRILSLLEPLRPDLLVATGDTLDAQLDNLEAVAAPLAAFRPPLGKIAVTGNHEFYAGIAPAIDFLRRAGFILLRNESLRLGDLLTVVGVDDPAAGREPDETGILETAIGKPFTIFLKHRPQVNANALGRFDLQLSGHTHRGQIFPFNYVTGFFYPLQNGRYPLADGSLLYTSRGTGTWGPPMRVLAPPEITLFEIAGRRDEPAWLSPG